MAENYSLNSQFGFNVSIGGGNVEKTFGNLQKEESELEKAINSKAGYIEKYENVFSGEVEEQINMYERQAMFVGMNLRAANEKRNFNVII